MNPFKGTFTAMITPFRDGNLDFDALENLVERQIEARVDGLVPCGTTGESSTLNAGEHDRIIERVVRIAKKRVPVIAGTGSNCTAETVQRSRHAAKCGADGLLIVAPYYNKPTQEGLFRHFSAIAEAVDVPIVIYNIPGRCGVEISIETICRLCDRHENIAAVKHATGSVCGAADLMQACDVGVLSGDDPLTLPLMVVGAVGVISVLSNLAPKSVKRLTQAALYDDYGEARDAHRAIYPIARALLSLEINPIPIKTAMAIRGYCAEEFRLPMCAMSAENRAKLEELLDGQPMD
ncbi:MAG: 4-hydroxy-tetrahydrodipicolinate synthase [Planctomycetes bacterium]|nr:4-hydroxy-tetrahydrodipicolinate synthase [Planctomycetota bacterium]